MARKKGRCKLIGNRFVIPHDTIPSNVRRKLNNMTLYIIERNELRNRKYFLFLILFSVLMITLTTLNIIPVKIVYFSISAAFLILIIYFRIISVYSKVGFVEFNDSLILINNKNTDQPYSWDNVESFKLFYRNNI